jgi:hypothetical protein
MFGQIRTRFQQKIQRVKFSTENLQKTALYDYHLSVGGKVSTRKRFLASNVFLRWFLLLDTLFLCNMRVLVS